MALRSRNTRKAEFSMSSMTDIIFLLLIFFLLTSTLVAPNAIPMLLPNSNTTAQATETLAVSIDRDLNFFVNKREVSVDDLEAVLTANLKGTKDEGIVLYADKSVPVDEVVKVLNIANTLKIKVVLATNPDKK
ncbi:MAG: biopolymer transporter ExbD [Chitinophagales bacterium]|nr:biopolymer transporter ExbD [Chitinophagales bacterium]HAE13890.1 biopolymer transporter ExbD [Bacteroidota bacterium]MCB9021588.1 biopolymer transporter ExbD [Chitinophagales bacterium]MCB9031159.1 biopolymer transporter ExbD [Chitinophagales bacterium]HAE34535.1 biopolymer transporter ExbD [Bacteroidota bacterium]